MLKKDLRKKYAHLRDSLSSSLIASQSITIANNLLNLPIWDSNYYHIFLPITHKKEIDTTYILSILQGKDKNILIPKIEDNYNLTCSLLTDNTRFKNNKWGVPEPLDGIIVSPKKIDVVFIPLLAFDKNGNRVGYGKGYYDNFLKGCREDILKIGLSFFEAEPEISDIYKDDIPLDYCVTPKNTYSFKGS